MTKKQPWLNGLVESRFMSRFAQQFVLFKVSMLYAFEQKACSLKVLGVYKYGHVPKSRHQTVLLVAQVSIGTKKEKLSVSSSPLNLTGLSYHHFWILYFLNGIQTNKLPNKKSNRKEEEKSQREKRWGNKNKSICLFSNDVCARPFKTREEARIVTARKRKHLDRGHFNSIDLDTHTHTHSRWRAGHLLVGAQKARSTRRARHLNKFRFVCFHPTHPVR